MYLCGRCGHDVEFQIMGDAGFVDGDGAHMAHSADHNGLFDAVVLEQIAQPGFTKGTGKILGDDRLVALRQNGRVGLGPVTSGREDRAPGISWRMWATRSPCSRAWAMTRAALVAASTTTSGNSPVRQYSLWRSTTLMTRFDMLVSFWLGVACSQSFQATVSAIDIICSRPPGALRWMKIPTLPGFVCAICKRIERQCRRFPAGRNRPAGIPNGDRPMDAGRSLWVAISLCAARYRPTDHSAGCRTSDRFQVGTTKRGGSTRVDNYRR